MIRNEEWSTMRRLLFMHGAMGAPLNEYEVTGNPAVFQTNVAKPLSGFTIPFLPIQSGTGDPSPENVRPISGWNGVKAFQPTGVNRFDEQWEVGQYNSSGIPASGTNQIRSKNLIPVEPETEYYLYIGINQNCRIYFCAENGSVISYQAQGKGTFTTPANCRWLKFHTGNGYGETYNNNISINYPATETGYNPFATVYPVTFPALGKNLLKVTGKTKTESGVTWTVDGQTVTVSGDAEGYSDLIIGYVETKGLQTVTISGLSGTENLVWNCLIRDENGTNIGTLTVTSNNITVDISEYPTADKLEIRAKRNNNIATSGIIHAQVETGSTATAYEPYTNTVYGGTLDAVNGVLTVTHRLVTLTGDEGFVFNVYGESLYVDNPIFSDSVMGSSIVGCCSMVKTIINGKVENYIYKAYSDRGLQFRNVGTYWGLAEVSSNAMNAKLQEWYENGTPLQVCYELATPYEIPLSDIPVPVTLIGDNTIWTDTNGSNTIKYKKKG